MVITICYKVLRDPQQQSLSIYLECEVKFCYHLIKIRDHKPVLKLPQIIENLRKEKILCI